MHSQEERPASLFRAEALEAGRSQRLGRIVLARPVGSTFLGLLFIGFAAGVVGFFCAFEYTRKVQVSGVLLPLGGLVRVVAPQSGVVAERRVVEGQAVEAGAPLFVVSSERATADRGEAQASISELMRIRRESLLADRDRLQDQSRQRLDAGSRQLATLVAEIGRTEAQAAMQRRRVALAEAAWKRAADLESRRFVSAAQVQDRQAEWLDQQLRLGELERVEAANAREVTRARTEQRDRVIQAERDEQELLRRIASLDQELTENEARRRLVLRSPRAGRVGAIAIEAGQSVAPGQVLATVLPEDAPLIAELHAPSRGAGFVRPGMDVLLRYQAYPYQKFGLHHGRVQEVSGSAMGPEQLGLLGASGAPEGLAEPLFRVKVALDQQTVAAYGEQLPLKPGMLLEGSVVLESRRLYEWVLDPLFTVTGRL